MNDDDNESGGVHTLYSPGDENDKIKISNILYAFVFIESSSVDALKFTI